MNRENPNFVAYRALHTIRLFLFRKPAQRYFVRDLEHPFSLWQVPSNSNKNLREPVYRMGIQFNRELDYPFPPYCKERLSPSDRAYIFAVSPDIDRYYACGACYFEWHEWPSEPPSYRLEWVWFHPYFRHRGLLSSAWAHFREQHHPFYIMHPVSPAMQSFLDKQGYVYPTPIQTDNA